MADSVDDAVGFGFLVIVDVGEPAMLANVGVPLRSNCCIAIVLPGLGDGIEPVTVLAIVVVVGVSCDDDADDMGANILLFNKGHP